MIRISKQLLNSLAIICLLWITSHVEAADVRLLSNSRRITGWEQHTSKSTNRYPHRAYSETILKELDIRHGDQIVDICAGDGWWGERIARHVGTEGIVHAAVVEQGKVDAMNIKERQGPSKLRVCLSKSRKWVSMT